MPAPLFLAVYKALKACYRIQPRLINNEPWNTCLSTAITSVEKSIKQLNGLDIPYICLKDNLPENKEDCLIKISRDEIKDILEILVDPKNLINKLTVIMVMPNITVMPKKKAVKIFLETIDSIDKSPFAEYEDDFNSVFSEFTEKYKEISLIHELLYKKVSNPEHIIDNSNKINEINKTIDAKLNAARQTLSGGANNLPPPPAPQAPSLGALPPPTSEESKELIIKVFKELINEKEQEIFTLIDGKIKNVVVCIITSMKKYSILTEHDTDFIIGNEKCTSKIKTVRLDSNGNQDTKSIEEKDDKQEEEKSDEEDEADDDEEDGGETKQNVNTIDITTIINKFIIKIIEKFKDGSAGESLNKIIKNIKETLKQKIFEELYIIFEGKKRNFEVIFDIPEIHELVNNIIKKFSQKIKQDILKDKSIDKKFEEVLDNYELTKEQKKSLSSFYAIIELIIVLVESKEEKQKAIAIKARDNLQNIVETEIRSNSSKLQRKLDIFSIQNITSGDFTKNLRMFEKLIKELLFSNVSSNKNTKGIMGKIKEGMTKIDIPIPSIPGLKKGGYRKTKKHKKNKHIRKSKKHKKHKKYKRKFFKTKKNYKNKYNKTKKIKN